MSSSENADVSIFRRRILIRLAKYAANRANDRQLSPQLGLDARTPTVVAAHRIIVIFA